MRIEGFKLDKRSIDTDTHLKDCNYCMQPCKLNYSAHKHRARQHTFRTMHGRSEGSLMSVCLVVRITPTRLQFAIFLYSFPDCDEKKYVEKRILKAAVAQGYVL